MSLFALLPVLLFLSSRTPVKRVSFSLLVHLTRSELSLSDIWDFTFRNGINTPVEVLTGNSSVFPCSPDVSHRIAVCQRCSENDSSPNPFPIGRAYDKTTVWTSESSFCHLRAACKRFWLVQFYLPSLNCWNSATVQRKNWRFNLSLSRKPWSSTLQVKSWSAQLRTHWEGAFPLRGGIWEAVLNTPWLQLFLCAAQCAGLQKYFGACIPSTSLGLQGSGYLFFPFFCFSLELT